MLYILSIFDDKNTVLFIMLDSINGSVIGNQYYSSSSWTTVFDIALYDNMLFATLEGSSNSILLVYDTLKGEFTFRKPVSNSNTLYSLSRSPVDQR